MQSYPWEMSGGMCQRVMLAMMLVLEPELLIADEPTSALDVTLQAEILERIMGLAKDSGTAVILITHDMGVIARAADRVMVMYGGRIVESADTVTLFHNPKHPYTAALLNAMPRLDRDKRPLLGVPGAPPDLLDPPDECPFLPRCNKATVVCRTNPMPPLVTIDEGHTLACYNPVTEPRIGGLACRGVPMPQRSAMSSSIAVSSLSGRLEGNVIVQDGTMHLTKAGHRETAALVHGLANGEIGARADSVLEFRL